MQCLETYPLQCLIVWMWLCNNPTNFPELVEFKMVHSRPIPGEDWPTAPLMVTCLMSFLRCSFIDLFPNLFSTTKCGERHLLTLFKKKHCQIQNTSNLWQLLEHNYPHIYARLATSFWCLNRERAKADDPSTQSSVNECGAWAQWAQGAVICAHKGICKCAPVKWEHFSSMSNMRYTHILSPVCQGLHFAHKSS